MEQFTNGFVRRDWVKSYISITNLWHKIPIRMAISLTKTLIKKNSNMISLLYSGPKINPLEMKHERRLDVCLKPWTIESVNIIFPFIKNWLQTTMIGVKTIDEVCLKFGTFKGVNIIFPFDCEFTSTIQERCKNKLLVIALNWVVKVWPTFTTHSHPDFSVRQGQ